MQSGLSNKMALHGERTAPSVNGVIRSQKHVVASSKAWMTSKLEGESDHPYSSCL